MTKLGTVEFHRDEYRAHVQYRSESEMVTHIRGPDRRDKSRAKADLAQMRACGSIASTREKGFAFMAGEAMRIRESAKYEAEIRAAMRRQSDQEREDEDEALKAAYEPEIGSDLDPEEPWLINYGKPPEAAQIESTPPSQKQPLTPTEATGQLKSFRPIKMRPADLEHLLACRADPNPPLGKGDITPLQNVLTFATEHDVKAMRGLLLTHGAHESEKEAKRWVTRQKADLCERVRLSEYYDDPQEFNPWDGAMERALM